MVPIVIGIIIRNNFTIKSPPFSAKAFKLLDAEAQILRILIVYISFHSWCKCLVKGAFKNHVDIILFYFDHPPTSVSVVTVVEIGRLSNEI